MSNIYTYIVPVIMTPESNNTFIQKRLVTLKLCPDINPTGFEALWNYNLCPQDEKYCQPWVTGDKIYSQIKHPGGANVYPVIVNGEDDMIIAFPDAGIQNQTISDADNNTFSNLVVDTNYMPAGICCFYITWVLYYGAFDFEDYADCYLAAIDDGKTSLEAKYDCLHSLMSADDITDVITEPYCLDKCRETILIEGTYLKYDCDGKWYGQAGQYPNIYKAQFRIPGEIVQQGYGFTEILLNNKKKSSKQVSNWLLRTPKIPPYVAHQMAVCFNSQTLTVNGIEFRKAEELAKNNEEGYMWIISTTLTTECEEINFTCS